MSVGHVPGLNQKGSYVRSARIVAVGAHLCFCSGTQLILPPQLLELVGRFALGWLGGPSNSLLPGPANQGEEYADQTASIAALRLGAQRTTEGGPAVVSGAAYDPYDDAVSGLEANKLLLLGNTR